MPRTRIQWIIPNSQPLTIVIRIPDVALSRSDLNASLGLQVDRYGASSGRPYAQIDIADHGDKWAAALDLIQSMRAFIPGLVSGGAIGTPKLGRSYGLSPFIVVQVSDHSGPN